MYYVYSIESRLKNYRYIGLTNSPKRRIEQHQSGRERTTAPYKPFKTILVERYRTRQEARKREKFLKSGVGRGWLKNLLQL